MTASIKFIFAAVVIGGTWWSMADVAWSSTLIQTHFVKAIAEPPVDPSRESGGGFMIVDDHVSECCEDLNNARALALWGTWLGGVPIAGMALVMWRRYRDRSLKSIAEPFLLTALVFQFASMTIAMLLFSVFLPYAGAEDLWPMLFLLCTALASGMAIPVWYQLRRRVVPSEPLLNIL
jgi:hypothetical protein